MGIIEAWKNMREVCIVGVGLHKFGRFPEKDVTDLGRVAIKAALEDAGAGFNDIEAGWCGRVIDNNGTGERIFAEFGQNGILIDNVEKACASSSTAARMATWAVAAGFYDVVMAIGVEKMERGLVIKVTDETKASYAQLMGMVIMPAAYALRAKNHMEQYGTKPEMFAQVAVKSHKNGALNPYAQYQKPVTLEEVLNSRMIAYPLTIYQCSPTTDGASAAIICAKEVAHRFRGKPVTIAGWASGTPAYSREGVGGDVAEGLMARLARNAYDMAGVGPEDIDVCQVHDAFSPGEVFGVEELGFCPPGEGGRYIWEGKADIGGEHPVNTDGGLESRGHPMGATGIAQMVEIVRQLRGEAGPRQVPGKPRVGLTHNVGASGCNVFVFKK